MSQSAIKHRKKYFGLLSPGLPVFFILISKEMTTQIIFRTDRDSQVEVTDDWRTNTPSEC